MTVAAVIRCWDGIVLCSDREITEASGEYKFRETKLFPIDSYDGKVALTYSGNPDVAESIPLEIANRINRRYLTCPDIVKVIQQLLKELRSELKKIQLLIVVAWKDAEPKILKYNAGRLSLVTREWDFIGQGDRALARFLAEFFGGSPFCFAEAKQAAFCALYILRQIEDFVPFVGQPNDALIITKEGEFVPISHSKAADIETVMLSAAGEVKRLASVFTNSKISAEAFNAALADFNAKVTAARLVLFKDGGIQQ